MCDFTFLKECVTDLQEVLKKNLSKTAHATEECDLIFSAIDSQIKSLENFVQNESRKKVLAEEKIQALESELSKEKAIRQRLESSGSKFNDDQIKIEQEKQRKLVLAQEAKLLAQELMHICIELRRIWRLHNADASKVQLEKIETVWENTKVGKIIPSSVIVSLEDTSTLSEALNVIRFICKIDIVLTELI